MKRCIVGTQGHSPDSRRHVIRSECGDRNVASTTYGYCTTARPGWIVAAMSDVLKGPMFLCLKM